MSKRPSIPAIPENEALPTGAGADSRRSSIVSDKAWPDLKPLKTAKVGDRGGLAALLLVVVEPFGS